MDVFRLECRAETIELLSQQLHIGILFSCDSLYRCRFAGAVETFAAAYNLSFIIIRYDVIVRRQL